MYNSKQDRRFDAEENDSKSISHTNPEKVEKQNSNYLYMYMY